MSTAKTWTELPGGGLARRIDVWDGTPWVIAKDYTVWFYDLNKWKQFPVPITGKDIAVVNATPYIIRERDNQVMCWRASLMQWIGFAGSRPAQAICCDRHDGVAWIIGTDNRIYRWSGNSWVEYGPTNPPRQALDIAVNGGIPYVVGTNHKIYKGTGSAWQEVALGGLASAVACDSERPATPWVIAYPDNRIFSCPATSWVEYGPTTPVGKGFDIAVWRGIPYAVGDNYKIYKGNV